MEKLYKCIVNQYIMVLIYDYNIIILKWSTTVFYSNNILPSLRICNYIDGKKNIFFWITWNFKINLNLKIKQLMINWYLVDAEANALSQS